MRTRHASPADVAKAGDVRICKPMTFMNASGRSVAALARFFGVAPDEILVVHDELDFGRARRRSSSAAGTPGTTACATSTRSSARPTTGGCASASAIRATPRCRSSEVVDYVLKPPDTAEREAIEAAIDRALGVWPDIAAGDMERAMMVVHTKDAS